jgi:hypothetical protein
MFKRSISRMLGVMALRYAATAQPVFAQSQGPSVPPQHEHPAPAPTADSTQQHEHAAAASTLFPTREASGTAWLPDRTPMYGVHRQLGAWEVMLHGNTFVQYLNEGGEEHRRGQQAGSINWFMGMARRPIAGGRVGVRAMLSLEPWTIPGCGYPVLLATGERCDGDSIHDRHTRTTCLWKPPLSTTGH